MFREILTHYLLIPMSQTVHKLNNQNGFTLLEGIIAIAVITIGMMAALALSLSNMLTARENVRRVVAANLAREGLEVVRNMRDTNWVKRDSNLANPDGSLPNWDDFKTSTGYIQGAAVLEFDKDGNKQYTLSDIGMTALSPDCATDEQPVICSCIKLGDSACPAVKLNSNGIYGTSGGDPTVYYRLITLQDLCLTKDYDVTHDYDAFVLTPDTQPFAEPIKAALAGVPCESLEIWINNPQPSRMTAKVGVMVTSYVRYTSNKTHDIVVSEQLYDWREE